MIEVEPDSDQAYQNIEHLVESSVEDVYENDQTLRRSQMQDMAQVAKPTVAAVASDDHSLSLNKGNSLIVQQVIPDSLL